jgi:hypothetical protein
MDWTAVKSGLLRYIIRLSPYKNVVLMALDILNSKLDSIIGEIRHFESTENQDHTTLQHLANLYHEICYLDLSEPVMKPFYQGKACQYAVDAFRKSGSEDDALLAVKYLLEADKVVEAKAIYDEVRRKGTYFFPRWITYEFELSVRLSDKELFNNLLLLIETGGGVFIPDKVKEAAQAWQRALTSAWL